MKVRTGFVSNSSSASFVLKCNMPQRKFFNIFINEPENFIKYINNSYGLWIPIGEEIKDKSITEMHIYTGVSYGDIEIAKENYPVLRLITNTLDKKKIEYSIEQTG